MIALTAAMQYLTPADHLWHINASADVLEKSRDGKVLHVPPETEVYLLPVPFVPWVSYFPGLVDLLNRSPQEMGEASFGWLNETERAHCRRVWEVLTQRQRDDEYHREADHDNSRQSAEKDLIRLRRTEG